jgi:transposase
VRGALFFRPSNWWREPFLFVSAILFAVMLYCNLCILVPFGRAEADKAGKPRGNLSESLPHAGWRHLLDRVPVSDLCEELGLQPTVFYRWQKQFFENGAAAFQTTERPRRQAKEKQNRIEFLEKKVQTKDEVLTELMAEHIALKKALGNFDRELGAARCAGSGGRFRPGAGRRRPRSASDDSLRGWALP